MKSIFFFFFTKHLFLAESCARLFTHGRRSSGFYNIHKPDDASLPGNQIYIRAWCDMDGPNAGWILLQERRDINFNFYRDWVSYENGFGKPGVGYWLGNIYMHALTFKRRYVIRIELPPNYRNPWRSKTRYGYHDNFQVLGPSSGYVLQVGKYWGDLGDIFLYVNNTAFSTWDRDNDKSDKVCAKDNKGAWWYGKSCYTYDLNSMVDGVEIAVKAKEVLGGNVPQ